MKKFATVRSVAAPLGRANVDTDQIVPKQFLKLVQRSGFERYLFYNWRFVDGDEGRPDSGFVLNNPAYAGSRILVAGANFGCGSSREHAVWALRDFGFDVVISPSFADIFYDNCFKNGVLPVVLPPRDAERILDDAEAAAAGKKEAEVLEVDLVAQTVAAAGRTVRFDIAPHRKRALLEGLDDIDLTLVHEDAISSFEKESRIPSVS